MIQVHTNGLQTVIPLLIWGVTSILNKFSILSAPSMCSFYNLLISFFKKSYFQWLFPYSTHFQFYQRHLLLNIFKTLMNCLNWLSRWYWGSYRRAANSYPPAYPVCHINTAHISNFISAIYDVIFLNFDKLPYLT